MRGGVAGWVFARGGSKGLPGKNLREVGGISLLAHAVGAGLAARGVDAVFVSTDDPELAAAGRAAGAEVPFLRPAHLATDGAPEWLAWRHAVEFLARDRDWEPEALVMIPPTAPLREAADLERCLARLRETGADIVLTVTPSRHNPSFSMVTMAETGTVDLVVPPPEHLANRQKAPTVYDITTVAYAVRPAYVMAAGSWREGSVQSVVVPAERAIDIDDELDLRIAQCLWETRR